MFCIAHSGGDVAETAWHLVDVEGSRWWGVFSCEKVEAATQGLFWLKGREKNVCLCYIS